MKNKDTTGGNTQPAAGTDTSGCSYYNKEKEPYTCEAWSRECETQDCLYKRLQTGNGKKELNKK